MGKIEKLNDLLKEPEQWAQRWKAQGGKVVGYLCAYIPEEIIFAASSLPLRIMGNSGETTSLANAYLQSNICPFVRSCLDQGLKRRYAHLDGIIFSHTCDGICKLHDAWKKYVSIPFIYMMDVPHRISPMSHDYFLKEIFRLKEALEEWAGQEITDDSLSRAIQIYNENRRLLKHLYSLRKKSGPDISGAEILQIMKLGMIMPKIEHSILLKEWIGEIKKRPVNGDQKPRIVISGSILDNPDLIQEIERGGCRIVADDLCMGTRYFWDEVATTGNPWEALGQRYFNKVPYSCIHSTHSRLDHILSMVKEFEADGVIYYKLKFCDNYHYDAPPMRERLKALGIPVLGLESEYASSGYGQLTTRVQAFLEMISVKGRA